MKTTFLVALLIMLLLGLSHPAHAQGPGQSGNGYSGNSYGSGFNGFAGQGNGFRGGNQGGFGGGFNGANNGTQPATANSLPEGVFKIYALEGDNSLVIVATPEGYRRVMAFLRSLGVVHSSYRVTDFDGNSFQVIPVDNKGNKN